MFGKLTFPNLILAYQSNFQINAIWCHATVLSQSWVKDESISISSNIKTDSKKLYWPKNILIIKNPQF